MCIDDSALSPCKMRVIPMETFFIAASGYCRISLVIYLYWWWIWIYASKGGEGHMNMNKRCMILDYKGRSQKNVPSNLVTASAVFESKWKLHSWRGSWMNMRLALRNFSHINYVDTLILWPSIAKLFLKHWPVLPKKKSTIKSHHRNLAASAIEI